MASPSEGGGKGNMKQRLGERKEKKESELLVFQKAKKLASYVMAASSKAPVKFRYSVLNPLIGDSLDVVRLLYEANAIERGEKERASLIRKAEAKVRSVDFLSTLLGEAKAFTEHQSETICLYSGECLKYLLGYLAYSEAA